MALGGLEFNVLGAVTQFIPWLIYGVFGSLMVGGVYLVSHIMMHRYKGPEYQLVAAGDGSLKVGRVRTQRYKPVNKGNAWVPLYPLFAKKNNIQPFSPHNIYQGNKVYSFRYENNVIPGEITVGATEKGLNAQINPIPHSLREWSAIEDMNIEKEFQNQDAWTQYKAYIIALGTIFICGAVAVTTVWLSYKFAQPDVSAMQSLTSAITNAESIIR